MERVRFLRAGLVTPLPGGPGIVPAGITTGARGAPLKCDPGVRVTPAHSPSREARPGLSRSVWSLRRAPRWSAARRPPAAVLLTTPTRSVGYGEAWGEG